MNKLKIVNMNGQQTIDSRLVAEALEMRHTDLLRKIDGYTGILENAKLRSHDFFIPDTYKIDRNTKTYKCYMLTKKGCEMVANKTTGEKGVIFTAMYVEAFNDMQQDLKSIQYQPKSTSVGEIASLIKPVISVMNKQGSKPYRIAKQVELTLNQFGIQTIPDFVNEPKKHFNQLAIAIIEED